MSLWILDTDTVTLLLRGHPAVCQRAQAHPPSDLAITIVTAEEMLSGWYAQIRRARSDAQILLAYRSLQEALAFTRQVNVLPFDAVALQHFHALKSMPVRIGTNDGRIAATVLAHQAILVTRNQRDFGQVPGLTMEDWAT